MSVWETLKRRKVVRSAIGYTVLAWIVIQVVVTLQEPMGLPEWTDTLTLALLAAGFPVAMLLSWAFDVTPDGVVQDAGAVEHSFLQRSTVLAASLVAFVAVLLVSHRLATGSWIFEPPPARVALSDVALISTFDGSHSEPTFSPDGSMIAFTSDVSGTAQIWVKNLAQGDPIQVTSGAIPAQAPSWSPTGDRILFSGADGNIYSVGPLGTPEPRLVLEDGAKPHHSTDGGLITYEWGPRIFVANPDGSDARAVSGVPPRVFPAVPFDPALSPDGAWIAFFLQSEGPNGDFWVVPSEGGTAQRLTNDHAPGGSPAWTPDGRHIVFSSRRAGSRTLWQIPREGGEPEPVTTGVGEDDHPALSRDGRLLYTNARVEESIMIRDMASGADTRVYDSRNTVWSPQVSPDRSRIAFFSEVAAGTHVFIIDIDGNNLEQVTDGVGEINIHPRFSADGESLLFYRIHPTRSLRRVPVIGGPSVEVFPDFTWETHMEVVESPEGGRIAFTRMEPPNWSRDHNLVVDLSTGAEARFASPHLHGNEWSKDGLTVLGVRDNNEITICPVDGAPCETLTSASGPVLGRQPTWSDDEEHIHFRRDSDDPAFREAWVVDRDGGNPRYLTTYGPVKPLDPVFKVLTDDALVWKRYDRARDELWIADIGSR